MYLLGTIVSIPALPSASIVTLGVFVIQAALQAVALFMLFGADARPWFRAAPVQPTTSDETDHNAYYPKDGTDRSASVAGAWSCDVIARSVSSIRC
jgi:hypothetical protein